MLNVSEKYRNELPRIMLDFLDYCEGKRKSEHTIKNYALDLRKWFKFQFKDNLLITEDNISKLKLKDLDIFIASLRDMSTNTVRRNIASIKSFYRYLNKYELVINNIATHIESPDLEERSPKYLEVNEIKKLINIVDKMNGRYIERDKAIITTFVTTGLRLSELVNIKTTDIKNGMLTVIGKGNKQRNIPLAQKTQKVIKDYLKIRKNMDGQVLFVTERNTKFNSTAMGNLVKKYLVKAGFKDYSTHKLRHSAATMWHDKGNDITKIQELLGHSRIDTTMIYTHGNKNLKDVVNNIDI